MCFSACGADRLLGWDRTGCAQVPFAVSTHQTDTFFCSRVQGGHPRQLARTRARYKSVLWTWPPRHPRSLEKGALVHNQ